MEVVWAIQRSFEETVDPLTHGHGSNKNLGKHHTSQSARTGIKQCLQTVNEIITIPGEIAW